MKKSELIYSIGDYVVVSAKMCRIENRTIQWFPSTLHPKPRVGQIVGLATRYSGKVEYPFSYEEPAYFIPTGTYTFWLVKFGLMNKPICVRAEDIRLARIDEVKELPRFHTRRCPLSKKDKQYLSEDSKTWPRDSKGRWTIGPVIHNG